MAPLWCTHRALVGGYLTFADLQQGWKIAQSDTSKQGGRNIFSRLRQALNTMGLSWNVHTHISNKEGASICWTSPKGEFGHWIRAQWRAALLHTASLRRVDMSTNGTQMHAENTAKMIRAFKTKNTTHITLLPSASPSWEQFATSTETAKTQGHLDAPSRALGAGARLGPSTTGSLHALA